MRRHRGRCSGLCRTFGLDLRAVGRGGNLVSFDLGSLTREINTVKQADFLNLLDLGRDGGRLRDRGGNLDDRRGLADFRCGDMRQGCRH